jgi:hypothetical protein
MSNSVEWLIEKCACADLRPELWEIIKQQAREMHKQETIEFAIHYTYGTKRVGASLKEDFIKLYEQTYGEERMSNNKAREINSPVIKQLLDETTPEELAKIDVEMSYDDGYKEGYKRAMELTQWAISNLIPPHNESNP